MIQKKHIEVNGISWNGWAIGCDEAQKQTQKRYEKQVADAVARLVPLKRGRKPSKIYRHGYYNKKVRLLWNGMPVEITLEVARLKYIYDDGQAPNSETGTFCGTILLKRIRYAQEILVGVFLDRGSKRTVEAAVGLYCISRGIYDRFKARLARAVHTVGLVPAELSGFLTGNSKDAPESCIQSIYGAYAMSLYGYFLAE